MDRSKEGNFRKFEGNLKVLSIRARYVGDEKAKEYQEVVDKLEQIRNNRHLAVVGEENEEGKLYSQLLDMIGNENSKDNYPTIYEKIRGLLSDYNLKVSGKEENETDIGEER